MQKISFSFTGFFLVIIYVEGCVIFFEKFSVKLCFCIFFSCILEHSRKILNNKKIKSFKSKSPTLNECCAIRGSC